MNKRILSLQDFSSIGRCSLTAAIPIVSALGNELVALPTAIYSTQTAIDNFTFTDLSDSILPAYNHFKSIKAEFDCLYTGFLGTISAVDAAIEIAKDFKAAGRLVAIDPAMADDGSLYSVFDLQYFNKMRELASLADVLLPNFTEGRMLSDTTECESTDVENAKLILNAFKKQGLPCVVLSGVTNGNLCGTATLSNGMISFQFNEKFEERIHGAGDILSSIVVSSVLDGMTFPDAAQKAVDFIRLAIKSTVTKNTDLRYGLNLEKCLPYLINRTEIK